MQEPTLFYPQNRSEWREWLVQNHVSSPSIWLVYYKKKTGKPTVAYSDAVDEALCFGWIDSTVKSIDDEHFIQFFTKRKPKSVWSKLNKTKVAYLIEQGLMTQAGLNSIEVAKQNGSWIILDAVEALVVPPDLQAAFDNNPAAYTFFEGMSRSNKRNILQWLVMAKRQETRDKRIAEIIETANEGKKLKQFGG